MIVDLEQLRECLALTVDQRARRAENARRRDHGRRTPLRADERGPLERLCIALTDGGVEFVVVGGQAAMLLGSYRLPGDIDFCHNLAAENRARLATVLTSLDLWTQPPVFYPELARQLDADRRARLADYPRICVTLEKDAWVDFVGDLPNLDYARLRPHAEIVRLADRSIAVQGLKDQVRFLTALADPERAEIQSHVAAILGIREGG